jgi:glycosyltransferase involved in cell wall biosynthesis
LKLSFFIPSLRGGGAERMFVRLATHFSESGHDIDMVLMNAKAMEYRDELSPDVRIIDLKTPRLWTSLPAFLRYLQRERPDAVISAMPLANGVAAWAKWLMKSTTALIITEHNAVSMAFGDLDMPRYRPLMWAIRLSYCFADAVVGVSSGVAERLRRIPGVRDRNVHVIYNPAWRPEMEARAREPTSHDWLAQPEVPVIIAVGRLEPQKDFLTLLNAFARIRQRRLIRLILLGDGSLRGALEAYAQRLGIAEDVSMPGFVENPFAHMARASLFALSSLHEGLPTVLIEALACGTPVVSTDCRFGPSEILDDGRYGPLVPVGDTEALAEAIERQLDHPVPPDLLRARAREFSVKASADAYLKLVEDLCVWAR